MSAEAPVDLSGLQRAVDDACAKIDELRQLLEEAVPYLRDGVRRCEGCEGAGVIVRGTCDEDSYEETCEGCKALQDLLERIEPRRPKPPPPVAEVPDDDIAF